MAYSLCGDGNYLLMGDAMKQVTNPPKTGEVFIVVIEDDEPEPWSIRYNHQRGGFERKNPQLGWIPISTKGEKRYLENVTIFVKG